MSAPEPDLSDKAGTSDEAQETIAIRVCQDIHEIGRKNWDACANARASTIESQINAPAHQDDSQCEGHEQPDSTPEVADSNPQITGYNPFISFDFLSCLEDSGSVGPQAGWHPHHLAVDDESGDTAAIMPGYLKTNSFGEFVFDHGWADAYERAGGRYYPKLQVSVPFTPVAGPRLLIRDPSKTTQLSAALVAGAAELTNKARASSAHWTFLPKSEWDQFDALGLLCRTDRQFHWFNRDYDSFDAFLAALASRKRKTIRRERRDALADGVSIEWVVGSDIKEHHWDAFHTFYQDTGTRKWGRPYLNRAFFSLLGERMADQTLLVFAHRDGRPIAGALNMIGSHALFGRHWGCIEDVPFLHFEVCYYQAIDFAIEHGLSRVEAGAQGEHKLARGYEPVTTYSAHYIANPSFRDAVADYLERERTYVAREVDALKDFTPFRKGE